jgi:hypothetical protein
MSQTARHELIASLEPRYDEAGWDDKRRILDEFTATTVYHRKYTIAVLNHPPVERLYQSTACAGSYLTLLRVGPSARPCGYANKAW